MPEKPEVNRSEAIRNYYKANPKATAKEVVDAVAKEGITVTTGLVYAVKGKHNKRRLRRGRQKQPRQRRQARLLGPPKPRARSPKSANPKRSATTTKPTRRPSPRKWSKPWQKRASRSLLAYVNTVRSNHKQAAEGSQAGSCCRRTGIGVPEIKAALTFLKSVGSVSAAKQALSGRGRDQEDRVAPPLFGSLTHECRGCWQPLPAAAEMQRQEEEEMTKYTDADLQGDWEFKIVRSNLAGFRKPEVLQQVCAEEAKAGWILVEKFDNQRLRFKRPHRRTGR